MSAATAAASASVAALTPYNPPAVLFHGFVGLRIGVGSGLAVTDTSHGLASWWILGTVGTTANSAPALYTINLRDVHSNLQGNGSTDSESIRGINWGTDNTTNVGRNVINANNSTGGTGNRQQGTYLNLQNRDMVWTHFMWAWDGTTAQPGRMAQYMNGVKLTTGFTGPSGTYSTPLTVNVSNNTGWGIALNCGNATAGTFGCFAMSDYWMDVGAQTASLLDSSNNLSAATINAFYNNGFPPNLGGNGSFALGSQPAVWLSGNSAAWATNQGYGGTVSFVAPVANTTLDQTLGTTTGQVLMDYPDGPLGGLPLAKIKWVAPVVNVTVNSTLGATGYAASNNAGNPIAQNDVLLIMQMVNDTTGPKDRSPGMTTPTGWTARGVATNGNPNGFPMNMLYLTRTADAGDVCLAGANWTDVGGGTNSGPPTLHYTDGAFGNARNAGYVIMNLGPCTVNQFAGPTVQTTSTTPAIPNITPAGGLANGTLITFAYNYSGGGASGTGVPTNMHQAPTGQNTIVNGQVNSSTQGMFINWQYLTSAAAISGMTFTNRATAPTMTASLILAPP